MNALRRRLDRLERLARAGQENPVRLIFQNDGESKEEALKKAGLSELDDNDINIFVFKWSNGKENQYPAHNKPAAKEPGTAAEIDRKIAKLKAELIRGGMTSREIAEIEEKHNESKKLQSG